MKPNCDVARFAADGFMRCLAEDNLVIVSRCQYCGAFIRGSVTEGLPAKEWEHRRSCTRGKGIADKQT